MQEIKRARETQKAGQKRLLEYHKQEAKKIIAGIPTIVAVYKQKRKASVMEISSGQVTKGGKLKGVPAIVVAACKKAGYKVRLEKNPGYLRRGDSIDPVSEQIPESYSLIISW